MADASESSWGIWCFCLAATLLAWLATWFNIYTLRKAIQKLEYMHTNPVRAGLAGDPCEWPWSSARDWLFGKPSPVPIVALDGPIVVCP